jgi:hypothetical protein
MAEKTKGINETTSEERVANWRESQSEKQPPMESRDQVAYWREKWKTSNPVEDLKKGYTPEQEVAYWQGFWDPGRGNSPGTVSKKEAAKSIKYVLANQNGAFDDIEGQASVDPRLVIAAEAVFSEKLKKPDAFNSIEDRRVHVVRELDKIIQQPAEEYFDKEVQAQLAVKFHQMAAESQVASYTGTDTRNTINEAFQLVEDLPLYQRFKSQTLNLIEKKGRAFIDQRLGKTLTKQMTQRLVKTAVGKAISTAVAGTLTGPLAPVFNYLTNKVQDVVTGLITKFVGNRDSAKAIAGTLIIIGALLLGGPLAPFLALLGLGMLMSSLSNNFGKILTIIVSIIISTLIVVAIGLLVALGSFIFFIVSFTVFSFFTIHNSAYLAPSTLQNVTTLLQEQTNFYLNNPALSITGEEPGGPAENEFMRVTKEANPNQASEPTRVTYTITIEALSEDNPLTNIDITDECHVFEILGPQQQGISCPSSSIPNPPDEITPGQPFTFSYDIFYSSVFENRSITNTVTVSADAGEGNQVLIASAQVTFGTPPSACSEGTLAGWPTATSNGEVLRGPWAEPSHTVIDAMDVGVPSNTPLQSIVDGRVSRKEWQTYNNGCEGNVIEVSAQCNGINFLVRYSHIAPTAPVGVGKEVDIGETIAYSSDSGWCATGRPHLHLDMKPAGAPGNQAPPPDLVAPYIPQTVPEYCNYPNCNVSW